MIVSKDLFGTYKQCTICHRPLPEKYESEACPKCQENLLFQRVKEYIRENDVNEYNVAAHFSIPVRQVKDWIREGRIVYKTDPKANNKSANSKSKITSLHCENCGAPVLFGNLCPKCTRLVNRSQGYAASSETDASRMRYLDKN